MTRSSSKETLEKQLNDFDPAQRREALEALAALAKRGEICLPEPRDAVNVHCHTFFSYNGYGLSPSGVAWKARCAGLAVVGMVDFDVLDGVEEFLDACRIVGVRGCAGMETRVFVPPFAQREINSPGEPGIAYHIGMGFTSGTVADAAFLESLKRTAQDRTRGIMARVNSYLSPVEVDYEHDVLSLTPNGNATERHLCIAYDLKSRDRFPEEHSRAVFWAEKLNTEAETVRKMFADAPVFQALIRSKLMKAGGVGYVTPEGPDFPALIRVNNLILSADALPVYAWLDGLSRGEQDIEELMDLMVEGGVVAVNIIPDRNWNIKDPETKRTKVAHLCRVIELCRQRALFILAGTEMNAYGQRFVDDFDVPELRPFVPIFLEGAYISYAHTTLNARWGMGYLSPWAKTHMASAQQRNAFFAEVGQRVEPDRHGLLDRVTKQMTPLEVLDIVRSSQRSVFRTS